MKKIKLLTIIESLGKGGAEQVLVNTLPELKKIGITCEVATLFKDHDLSQKLMDNDINVHKLDLSNKWNILEAEYKIYNLVKKEKFDIIHAHLFFAYFYIGVNKIFFPKIATITTFHNQAYNVYPANTLIKKFRKKMDSFIVNKFIDGKVAVSAMVKEHYEKNLCIDNIDVIFNSFPLSNIKNFILPPDKTIFEEYTNHKFSSYSITPGRLVKEKGHKYLIESFSKIKKELTNHCHFIVGSGPLSNDIKELIKIHNLHNIIVIQGLEQSRLFSLINSCDFVIIPSISEGFPMVVGECMALGKAIIATEISGTIDMIEHNTDGILVPSKNVDILSSAILNIVKNDDLRNEISKNALSKISKFDTKIIALKWQKYYEDLLKK